LTLARADVSWFLSVDRADLPPECHESHRTTYRVIDVDGESVEFSEGFADLHTKVYERTLRGDGFGIADARPSIELVHRLRTAAIGGGGVDAHPLMAARRARG
jgi:UDP-N-acetyl-2-amino-2-deoxyglucuronate dehydrogenase